MNIDLRAALPFLIPKAVSWAEEQYTFIAEAGHELDDLQLAVAKNGGVMRPECIRVADVACLPQPDDPVLREAAFATGLFGNCMACMTFGYGLYVCHGYSSFNFLFHEFQHVKRYEQAGSIATFLPAYFDQLVSIGRRHNGLFEVEIYDRRRYQRSSSEH